MTSDPLRSLARALERRGLGSTARLLADAHRPLGPLLADLGVAAGPFAAAVGGERGAALAAIAGDPAALDRLVAALDDQEDGDAEPG